MSMPGVRLCVLLLFGIFAGSCNTRTDSMQLPQNENRDRNATLALADVKPLNEDGFRALVSERNGKILFVNVWATWCAPCVEEFPDIVRLAESDYGKSVDFVAISVDFPDEIESKILPFVREHSVPFDVYVADFQKQELLINTLNESWSGAIPATFIYDPMGRQRSSMIGKQSFDRFAEELELVRGSI